MPELPPSGTPEAREHAELDALIASNERQVEIERKISAALKELDPRNPKQFDAVDALFAEARDAAAQQARAFTAWKAAR